MGRQAAIHWLKTIYFHMIKICYWVMPLQEGSVNKRDRPNVFLFSQP
jgi:hypothetical protein